MRGKVEITGLREMNAAFDALGKATSRNVLRRVGIKALDQEFVPEARRLAPDDPETSGNDLHSSIIASDKLNARQKALFRKREDKSFAEVYAGPTRPHGLLQEFGTAHHGPQPFMRPAWDATWRKILDNVARGLWAEIEKAVARKAKRDAKKAGQ